MKNLFISLAFMFLFPALAFCAEPAGQNTPLTLFDCYKLALKQSEIIAVDAELIKQAEAHFLQAFGTLMPQVSFSNTITRNNSAKFPSYNNTHEGKFAFTQALFSGFKELAGMSGSHLEKSQRENELLRAEQLLFGDVSDAFYLFMEERDVLKALETTRKAFLDRIDELKTRVNLGKSRTSEVVSTEVQLYTIEDQIESVKSQEAIAKELLEFLVGRTVAEITESEIDFALKPESEYLAKASSRTDVQAANFAWQADKKRITIAKSGFLPQINLEGDVFSHRSSAPTDSRWEALLTIDVPIFEGTTTYGQVKEAISKARQSELLFNRAGRTAYQDIHDAYVDAQADLLRAGVLGKALKSAELNYDLQLQDYKLNVVNNLDVLTAIQNLEGVRRNFIHISYESKRFYWQLLVAVGEIDLGK
jgi:outer membrane protein